jgi:hypothetical protein
LAELAESYTDPLDRSLDDLERAEQAVIVRRQQHEADVAAGWHRYSTGYEQLLSPDAESDDLEDARLESSIWNPPRRISTGAVHDRSNGEETQVATDTATENITVYEEEPR